jgi:hypothetical protein
LLPASPGLLLGLPFDPEVGGDLLLRNVGLTPYYTVLQPNYTYENLKFIVF